MISTSIRVSTVRCPTCYQAAGEPCVPVGGFEPSTLYHVQRLGLTRGWGACSYHPARYEALKTVLPDHEGWCPVCWGVGGGAVYNFGGCPNCYGFGSQARA